MTREKFRYKIMSETINFDSMQITIAFKNPQGQFLKLNLDEVVNNDSLILQFDEHAVSRVSILKDLRFTF